MLAGLFLDFHTRNETNLELKILEAITETHSQSKGRVVEPSHNRYIYTATPAPKTQGSLRKRKQKDQKSQRLSEFAVGLSPRKIRSHTRKVSPTRLSEHEPNKDNC